MLENADKIRHSAAHVLAAAVAHLFPNVKFDIGPKTEEGFYYDFALDHTFTAEDLTRLEAEMQRIIDQHQDFIRTEMSRQEAEDFLNHQTFKLERLADIPDDEVISFYQNGDFIDLCRGPHVDNTAEIKAFKLLSIAGVYYRGDEHNPQLQRIYGVAFSSKKELEDYLHQREEAQKRDHRKLGKELELFLIDEAVGQGLILWLPKGTIVKNALQSFISEELEKRNYQLVSTPHIAKLGLFRTSGHFPYYKDSQYPPIAERATLEKNAHISCRDLMDGLESGNFDGFLLKPMNCPGHIRIYASKGRSYRDLPMKIAEFGTVYRWEQSGELSGMTRVRGFTQDDAHIFCTEEQLPQEIAECLDLVKIIFSTLGMAEFKVRVSLRDPASDKYIGSDAAWEKSERALKEAAQGLGVPYSLEPGEAAFYGPKIDFVVKDVIGREWQLGTIQVDYNLPERFDLTYIGPDNQPHRPVMIHRAPFGSMERFCGLLIEHFAGDFPTWLAPEQVRILTLSDAQIEYGQQILAQVKEGKLRASLDASPEKLGAKIRKAELAKVPYMFIVGPQEQTQHQVTIRSRHHKEHDGASSIDHAIQLIVEEAQSRQLN